MANIITQVTSKGIISYQSDGPVPDGANASSPSLSELVTAAPGTLITMRTESLPFVGGAGVSVNTGVVSVRAKRTSPSGTLAPGDPVDVWLATIISATGDIPLSFTLPAITGWPSNGTVFCLAVVMNVTESPNTTFPALWTVSATGGGASLSFTPGLAPGVGNWTCGGSGGFLVEFHLLYYTAT